MFKTRLLLSILAWGLIGGPLSAFVGFTLSLLLGGGIVLVGLTVICCIPHSSEGVTRQVAASWAGLVTALTIGSLGKDETGQRLMERHHWMAIVALIAGIVVGLAAWLAITLIQDMAERRRKPVRRG